MRIWNRLSNLHSISLNTIPKTKSQGEAKSFIQYKIIFCLADFFSLFPARQTHKFEDNPGSFWIQIIAKFNEIFFRERTNLKLIESHPSSTKSIIESELGLVSVHTFQMKKVSREMFSIPFFWRRKGFSRGKLGDFWGFSCDWSERKLQAVFAVLVENLFYTGLKLFPPFSSTVALVRNWIYSGQASNYMFLQPPWEK